MSRSSLGQELFLVSDVGRASANCLAVKTTEIFTGFKVRKAEESSCHHYKLTSYYVIEF